jgi:hypothetical protein
MKQYTSPMEGISLQTSVFVKPLEHLNRYYLFDSLKKNREPNKLKNY